MSRDLLVRHFRQIAVWPLQLMPVSAGPVQRHWELLDAAPDCGWAEVVDEFCEDPQAFQERHYREFVTFLPHAQRFLYGSSAGQERSRRRGEGSIRTYRRRGIHAARITFERGGPAWTFRVKHADLNFFLDADVALLAFEMHAAAPTSCRTRRSCWRTSRPGTATTGSGAAAANGRCAKCGSW